MNNAYSKNTFLKGHVMVINECVLAFEVKDLVFERKCALIKIPLKHVPL